jgi:hypothetical protein
VYFVIDSARKLLDTPSYVSYFVAFLQLNKTSIEEVKEKIKALHSQSEFIELMLQIVCILDGQHKYGEL